MTFLDPSDLDAFASIDPAKAQAMIDDAEAMAALAAPCILSADFENKAAVKAILRGAVLRWNDSGSGAMQSTTSGPFGQVLDTRQDRKGMFWPSEIEQLQNLCGPNGSSFTLSVAGDDGVPSVPPYPFNFCRTF